MKLIKIFSIILIAIACMVVTIACSNGNSPVSPVVEGTEGISQELPIASLEGNSNRSLLAVYDAVIDPAAKTFTITPSDRSVQYHYPLSLLYSNVLYIVNFGWTPNFWAEIKLKHPLPGSGLTGYDPRVIAILPARTGVSCNYPVLDVHANNSVILEPDGYTKLFDGLTSTPGNTNPFIAYFKSQPYRRWSGTGVTEETKRWQMNLSGFGGPIQFQLVVDVSTNYPNPPQPEIDNAPEPVQIEATGGQGLTSYGGSTDITVTIMDWQGRMSVGGVQVESPDLFNGTVNLVYSTPGPNPDEYVFTGTISNSLLAPEGEYKILLAAWDQATGIYIYSEFTVNINDGGSLIWVRHTEGSGCEVSRGITTLSDNSTVVTGSFGGSIEGTTFGEGEPNETTLHAASIEDIFIARYNPDGTLAWAKRAGGSDDDDGIGITTLSDNSIVVTGFFEVSATFGQGEPNQTVLNSAGRADIFIARYNPDGTLAWAKRAGGSNHDYSYEVTTLSDNSTVLTGYFEGSATFGSGELNEKVLWSAGFNDIFVAKYNPNGTLAWVKRAGGSDYDYSFGISSLLDNSTIITGTFSGSATFGSGEIYETVLTGDDNIFIARYNSSGTLAWAKQAGGSSGGGKGYGIATLLDNSVVLTGCFGGSTTFGSGEPHQTVLDALGNMDVFIARYNSNGTLEWVKRAGGTDDEVGNAITTLSDNSSVVTGYFGFQSGSPATFGSGEINETVLTPAGEEDIFIARYNPDGLLEWVKQAGGIRADDGNGITALSDNSTVATGVFMKTATFGPGEPNETILTSTGIVGNIFVARFEP